MARKGKNKNKNRTHKKEMSLTCPSCRVDELTLYKERYRFSRSIYSIFQDNRSKVELMFYQDDESAEDEIPTDTQWSVRCWGHKCKFEEQFADVAELHKFMSTYGLGPMGELYVPDTELVPKAPKQGLFIVRNDA